MTALDLAAEEREDLIERADEIGDLAETSEAEVGKEAAGERMRWYRELQDRVLDLCNVLPAGAVDYEARRLLQFMAELGQAIEDDPDAVDPRGRVRLARMRMLDVARRLKRRLQHRALDVPEEAARFVFDSLPEIPATELSELLGVSTKTIGAWKQGKPVKTNADRVILVARLLAYLRMSMTPHGFMLWFKAKQDALGARTPQQVLDQGRQERLIALTTLARGGRGQLAD